MDPVFADPGQIEQVLINLVVNARDAMPNGGTLTIQTRGETLAAAWAAEHPGAEPGLHACLAVSDTGTGIDLETQARIFEPFFTTKEPGQGTGLGLATVHGIVTQSGGHLAVSSQPGLGTTFSIYLPASDGEPAVRAFEPPSPPDEIRGHETILVCEDDELVRTLVDTILTDAGYRVLVASRPSEALELARGDSPIDVLVTDVVMPQMSGPELLEQLETLRPGLKAVFVSGYTTRTIRGRELPPDSVFLQKPFDTGTMLQTIRRLLEPDAHRAGGGAQDDAFGGTQRFR
jgi:CheY-like chemotaxis protein